MREAQFYMEELGFLSDFLQGHLREVPDELFYKRPFPKMNPIGFIYYHLLRMWDYDQTIARRMELKDDLWHRENWAEKAHYQPAGLGIHGLGVGIGYTDAEVDALQIPRQVLTDYHNAILAETRTFMDTAESADIRESRPHPITEGLMITAAERLQHTVLHSAMHVGEIRYIKGIFGYPDSTYPLEQ